jgi:nucleotide-binding universal stress UspA family protein
MRTTTMIATHPTRSNTASDETSPGGRIGHVLLATDLEEASAGAADHAIYLAARHRAVLQILAVARTSKEAAPMERGVRALRLRACALGVVATSVVWHGDPAEAILEAAWTERPDVLVLGSRRSLDLGRVVHGSVSKRVAREAPTRVLVVPVI